MSRNQKQKFIDALRSYAKNGGVDTYDPIYNRVGICGHRGDSLLARAIADYLDEVSQIPDEQYVNWFAYLHKELVDAFDHFRTHERWQWLRDGWAAEFPDEEITDLVNIHTTRYGGLTAHHVAYLCAVLSGEKWLHASLEGKFDAQWVCVGQSWLRFVRVAYRELMPRIKKEDHRGNGGKFGKTRLLTYAIAGRVCFTFKRGHDRDDVQITYVADDSDMWGHRSGPNSTRTPYQTCIEMIDEVTDNWDIEKMKPDEKVGMF